MPETAARRNLSDERLTQVVLESFENAQSPRIKEVLQALVKHLHAFAVEVQLTEEEWAYGIDFLTRTGHITDDKRQEFILLSDVLGLSMQVIGINHPVPDGATENTVFGPFFVANSPAYENGDDIANGAPGAPCLMQGQVRGLDGQPIAGARMEIWQADIRLDGARVPETSRLPGARKFKDAGRVLVTTRTTCAWGALGHAVAAYDTALTYTKQREQFGKPLCSFQIVQDKLVKMLAEVTGMQLYCMQLARLEGSGRLTDTIAGLAKLNNTRKARQVIAEARDMLGGNGVLLENHVIRHMGDIEVIHTYEGTATMQALIVGRDITGVGAFA